MRVPAALRGSLVPALLATVSDIMGFDTSCTCSRFVSVSSSLEGVMFTTGSDGPTLGDGAALTGAGARLSGADAPISSVSTGGRAGGNSGADFLGAAAGGALALTGTGFGLGAGLSMLAQLLVPSGFRAVFGVSATEGGAASAGVTISQDAASGDTDPPFAVSAQAASVDASAGASHDALLSSTVSV